MKRKQHPFMYKTRRDRSYYLAYGANTNIESMARRCPQAEPVGKVALPEHRLQFRGVADVVVSKREPLLHLAMWRITPECEKSLDAFEGYPYNYIKRYITIPHRGRAVQAMLYVMRNQNGLSLPSDGYERMLREGYAQFNMPAEQIDAALERARRFYVRREPQPKRGRLPRGTTADFWTPYVAADYADDWTPLEDWEHYERHADE